MPTIRPILFVHSSDEMYGADRMLLEFIAALPDQERQAVLVWLPTDVPHGANPLCAELARRGIAYEHVDLPILRRRYLNPSGLAGMAARWRDARRRLRALDPQWLVAATSAVLPLVVGLGRRTNMPVVLHMQEIWDDREARVLGAMAHRVDHVVAISDSSLESLPGRLRERASVVPNGTPAPGEVAPLDEHSGELVFIVASRWNAWKGHEVLLKAWELAEAPGRLVILGGPPSLGQAVDVPGMVQRNRYRDTITVLGEVTDAGRQIEAADVMIVPSTNPEPFGLVTIESFARGRPVIATAAGGSGEIVTPGTGWLVPPGDAQALAEVLRGLTRAQVEQAGAHAQRRFEAQYSTHAFGSALTGSLADWELLETPTDTRVLESA